MGNNMISIIKLSDINEKKIFVSFSEIGKKKLFNRILQLGALSLFSKTINTDKSFFNRFKKTNRISLGLLNKIFHELDVDEYSYYSHITLLTSDKNSHIGIKNPKLPFKFDSPDGMRIIAGIMGDGSIAKSGYVGYYNKQIKLIKIFKNSMFNVFGDVCYKFRLRPDRTYNIVFPKIIAYVLRTLGMDWGMKTENNSKIPAVVKMSDYSDFFIKQFFNDEGNVRLKDRRLQIKQTIITNKGKNENKEDIITNCPCVLRDIQILLKKNNIISKISLSSYRKMDTNAKADWELSIYGKRNLELFQRNIGFDLNYKSMLLEKSLKSYIHPSAPRNQRLLFAMQYCALSQIQKGHVDKEILSTLSGRAVWRTSTYYLVDLLKKKYIFPVEKSRRKNGIPLPWKYKITNQGWIYLKKNKDNIFLEEVIKKIEK